MESKLTIDQYGTKIWRNPNSGVWHREDGPGIEYVGGSKHWYLNGIRHREDNPAIEYINGDKEWWLNGIKYTEQEYKHKTRSRKLKLLL